MADPTPIVNATPAPAAPVGPTPEEFNALKAEVERTKGEYQSYAGAVAEVFGNLGKYVPEAQEFLKEEPSSWDKIAETRRQKIEAEKTGQITDPAKIAEAKMKDLEQRFHAVDDEVQSFKHAKRVDETGRAIWYESARHEIFSDPKIQQRAIDRAAQILANNPGAAVSEVMSGLAKEETDYRDAIIANYTQRKETVRQGMPPAPTAGGGAPPGQKPPGPPSIDSGAAQRELQRQTTELLRANS